MPKLEDLLDEEGRLFMNDKEIQVLRDKEGNNPLLHMYDCFEALGIDDTQSAMNMLTGKRHIIALFENEDDVNDAAFYLEVDGLFALMKWVKRSKK